jgi:hypothetical protein
LKWAWLARTASRLLSTLRSRLTMASHAAGFPLALRDQ